MRGISVLTAVAAAGVSSAALADVAVTNENNGDGGTVTYMTGSILRATSFTTGGAGATITSIDLRVYNRNGVGSTNQLTGGIYADAGGQPGALVGAFGDVFHTQVAFNGFDPISFTTSGIPVAANTTYWFVVGDPFSSAGTDWLGTVLNSETSTMGWTIGDGHMAYAEPPGPGWLSFGAPGRFTVNVEVPAPGAAALAGVGGVLAARRRRR